VLEATPSPSGGTNRVATPPVSTTPDVVVPSPTGGDTPSSADAGQPAMKRPRLRSTKSELFIVNSEQSRDVADADGSCEVSDHKAGGTVASLVSDDSVDSTSVADMSQNSVSAVSAEAVCLTGTDNDVAGNDHFPSADESSVVQVCNYSPSAAVCLQYV